MSSLIVRSRVFPDESLASYIYRVSNLNCCKFEWVYEPVKVNIKNKYSVLNSFPSKELSSIILDKTGLVENQLLNMTLSRFNFRKGYSELEDKYYFYKFSKFCPLCLKENHYHRIYWQLNSIKICMDHNILLVNRCLCGNFTTIDDVISGSCHYCGQTLLNMSYCYNDYESIYLNQLRLYYAMNIEFSNSKQICLDNSLCLRYEKNIFLCLYDFLNNIVEHANYNEAMDDLREIYLIQLDNNNALNSVELIEEMLKEWPNNFYKFLDYSNSRLAMFSSDIPEAFSLFLPIQSLINRYYVELFSDILIKYLLLRYKFFYKSIFETVYDKNYSNRNEYYIPQYTLCRHFGLPDKANEIASLFKTVEIKNATYVNMDDVLEFFYNFFKNAQLLTDADNSNYIEITELYDLLLVFKCSLKTITDAILTNKVSIKIEIRRHEFSMIFVEKDKAIRYILHELVKIYDNKDSLIIIE